MKNFGLYYQRRLRGKSRFVWTDGTLAFIIHGLYRHHRSKPNQQTPFAEIAPRIRSLICEYVKNSVCDFNKNYGCVEGHFERIRARWICFPSLRAIVHKLQLYSQFVKNAVHGLTKSSYQKMRDSGSGRIVSCEFYMAFNHILHLNRCYLDDDESCFKSSMPSTLPASPMLTFEPVYGYCYTCGVGLTEDLSEDIDFKFIPRRCCVGLFDHRRIGGDDVCLCSGCTDKHVFD
jgi:hypothetical protein